MSPAASPKAPTQYPFIDSLRGVALLGVLCIHASQPVGDFPGRSLAVAGQYGVQLFFLASALTLFLSFAARGAAERHPLRNYFVRRLLRILPLFWFGILLYGVVFGLRPRYTAPEGISGWHILLTALTLHGWHPTTFNSVVPGGWSIAVEVTFYLLLPLLVSRLRSLGAALAWALGAAALSVPLNHLMSGYLVSVYPPAQHYLVESFLSHWFPSQLGVFFLGAALYHALRAPRIVQWLAGGAARPLLWGSCAGLLLLSQVDTGPWPAPFLYGVLFFGVALAMGVAPPRALLHPALRRIGVLSYSCYITHFAAVGLVAHGVRLLHGRLPAELRGAGWVRLCEYGVVLSGALAITLVAARATHAWIEKPGMELGKRLIKRWEAAGRG